MEKSQARIHFLFVSLGLIAVGAALAFLLLGKKETSVNSEIFQHKYLSGIQHVIDLGKNLNSYSDFLYQEIKSPRGRDSSIFAAKAQSSLKLFMNKNLLSKAKKRETEQAMQSLMEKSYLIISHLEEGETELARRIYEKEYLEELKSFHLELDSHKKYIQNQAVGFFSRNLSGNKIFSDNFVVSAVSAFLFCVCCVGILWLKWNSSVNRAMADRRGLVSRLEALAEGGFKVNEIFEHIRENCRAALNEGADLAASIKEPRSNLPAPTRLKTQLDRRFEYEVAWLKEHERLIFELEQSAKAREKAWNDARIRLKAFSKVKIELLNSGLVQTGRFEFGPEILALLEELEDAFSQNPFEGKMWGDLGESARALETKVTKDQESISKEMDSLEVAYETARFEMGKAYKEWERNFEEKIAAAERCLAKKNELLTAILVLTDPHELPEDVEMGADGGRAA